LLADEDPLAQHHDTLTTCLGFFSVSIVSHILSIFPVIVSNSCDRRDCSQVFASLTVPCGKYAPEPVVKLGEDYRQILTR
jgi:hypothetical protein